MDVGNKMSMKCEMCNKEKKLLFLVHDRDTDEEYILCQKDIITEDSGRDTILGIITAINKEN